MMTISHLYILISIEVKVIKILDFRVLLADSKLILLKLIRLEQQQQYQTQLLQKILDVMQASDGDAGEVPEGVALPVKTVAAMKELERKLQDEEVYRKLVKLQYCVVVSSLQH